MTMLYLLRHAPAEDPRAGQPDADRALTPDGLRKFRRAATGIAHLLQEAPPTLLLSSPALRARQTAEILREEFDRAKVSTQLRITPALLQDSLRQLLKESRDHDTVAVGHEPILSAWLGLLCFGTAGRAEMKKGAVAAIEMLSPARGKLIFLLQPATLRAL